MTNKFPRKFHPIQIASSSMVFVFGWENDSKMTFNIAGKIRVRFLYELNRDIERNLWWFDWFRSMEIVHFQTTENVWCGHSITCKYYARNAALYPKNYHLPITSYLKMEHILYSMTHHILIDSLTAHGHPSCNIRARVSREMRHTFSQAIILILCDGVLHWFV